MKKQRFIIFTVIAMMVFSFVLSVCDNGEDKGSGGIPSEV